MLAVPAGIRPKTDLSLLDMISLRLKVSKIKPHCKHSPQLGDLGLRTPLPLNHRSFHRKKRGRGISCVFLSNIRRIFDEYRIIFVFDEYSSNARRIFEYEYSSIIRRIFEYRFLLFAIRIFEYSRIFVLTNIILTKGQNPRQVWRANSLQPFKSPKLSSNKVYVPWSLGAGEGDLSLQRSLGFF